MKKLVQICLMLCVASTAFAQDDQQTQANAQAAQKVLRVYDWKDLISQHPFPNSEIVSMDGISVLKVENTNNNRLEISLLKITNSALIKNMYSLSWEMKYEDVATKWGSFTNDTPSGKQMGETLLAATLTLINYIPSSAPGGDERIINMPGALSEGGFTVFSDSIQGTSNWRPYKAGVYRWSNVPLPDKLDFQLFVPAKGTIYLRPLKLMGIKSNWWSPQLSGLIGGIGGSLLGCLGGLIGCLASMGKARGFVLPMIKILIALGILMAIAGIIAVASGQPCAVWYPLVLTGGILTFVFSVNLYPAKKRYDDMEIRRMTSMDATGR